MKKLWIVVLLAIICVGCRITTNDDGRSSTVLNTKKSQVQSEVKTQQKQEKTPAKEGRKVYRQVVERKMLNQALILSVCTSPQLEELTLDELRTIAASLVIENPYHYMIRVFFHNCWYKPGQDAALCRFEWTESQGLVLTYDIRSNK